MAKSIKMLHAADIHAGRPLTATLSKEKAVIRHKEINGSLGRIVEAVKAQSCQILLLAGDLFEHAYARAPFIREVADLLASIPASRVLISPGNHDPFVPDSLYASIKWPENVKIFSSERVEEVSLKELGVTIYGLGWTGFMEKERLLKGLRAKDSEGFNILLCHGDFVRQRNDSDYLPILPEDLEDSRMDYAALGHIHAPSQFRVGSTLSVYPGCPEPLDGADTGERGFFVVNLEKDEGTGKKRINAEFIPACLRQVHSVSLDITGLDTVEKVRNSILSVDKSSVRSRDIYNITIRGAVDPELDIHIANVEQELEDAREFFSLKLVPAYGPDYSIDDLLSENADTLEERFAKTLSQMADERRRNGNERGAEVAKLALWYGLDALRLGEVLLRGRRSLN